MGLLSFLRRGARTKVEKFQGEKSPVQVASPTKRLSISQPRSNRQSVASIEEKELPNRVVSQSPQEKNSPETQSPSQKRRESVSLEERKEVDVVTIGEEKAFVSSLQICLDKLKAKEVRLEKQKLLPDSKMVDFVKENLSKAKATLGSEDQIETRRLIKRVAILLNRTVEKNKRTHVFSSYDTFLRKEFRQLPIEDFLTILFPHFSRDAFLGALVLLDRVFKNTKECLNPSNLHSHVLAALILSAKFIDAEFVDETFNRRVADSVQALTSSLLDYELCLLDDLEHNAYLRDEQLQGKHKEVAKVDLPSEFFAEPYSVAGLNRMFDAEMGMRKETPKLEDRRSVYQL